MSIETCAFLHISIDILPNSHMTERYRVKNRASDTCNGHRISDSGKTKVTDNCDHFDIPLIKIFPKTVKL